MQRLTLSLLLVVLTAVVGLGWGIDRWYNTQYADEEDPAVSAYKKIGSDIARLIDAGAPTREWLTAASLPTQLTAYADFPLPDDVQKNFETGAPLLLKSGDQVSLHFYLARQQQVLSFTLPAELNYENDNALRWLLTLIFYGGVILMVLIWLYPLLSRLALLRKTAQAFGAGDLHARIAADKHSYIQTIEQDFNRMAQRIEQLVDDNKLLSRGLSHDLRTPLARLRFGLDVLEEANLTAEQQQNLAHLNRDLIAMESLVEALLNYARLEQATITLTTQSICLAHFVTQLHSDFYPEVELHIAASAQATCLQGDTEYLAMLIHNLVQNALRYGCGRVQLSVLQSGNQLQLCVEDNGSGIPEAEREKVLKPFCRGTGSQHQGRGHGLGLAIVERIAQWHGAELLLTESAELGGLSVSIIFAGKR